MDAEFVEAHKQLMKDNQLVHLQVDKILLWMLLTPIQLASKSPFKKHTPIKVATETGKRLQNLLTKNSPILQEVAKAGWEAREPKCSFHQARLELKKLDGQEILIEMSKYQIWCVICACQLASRHPEYARSDICRINKSLLDQLSAAIPEGILSIMLKSGWDNRFDAPMSKGFSC